MMMVAPHIADLEPCSADFANFVNSVVIFNISAL